MHNYIWNIYLHTKDLEMNTILFVFHHMINLIEHSDITSCLQFLATEPTSSLQLSTVLLHCFDSTTAITTSFFRILIHSVVESNTLIVKVLLLFLCST
jgi:hypothetical protein